MSKKDMDVNEPVYTMYKFYYHKLHFHKPSFQQMTF